MTQSTTKTVYTAKVHTVGGRDKGEARSSDGRLDIKLSVPGGPGTGTNPEQLLAAGWSACFEGAIMLEARKKKVRIEHLAIDAEIDLNQGATVIRWARASTSACRTSTERWRRS